MLHSCWVSNVKAQHQCKKNFIGPVTIVSMKQPWRIRVLNKSKECIRNHVYRNPPQNYEIITTKKHHAKFCNILYTLDTSRYKNITRYYTQHNYFKCKISARLGTDDRHPYLVIVKNDRDISRTHCIVFVTDIIFSLPGCLTSHALLSALLLLLLRCCCCCWRRRRWWWLWCWWWCWWRWWLWWWCWIRWWW